MIIYMKGRILSEIVSCFLRCKGSYIVGRSYFIIQKCICLLCQLPDRSSPMILNILVTRKYISLFNHLFLQDSMLSQGVVALSNFNCAVITSGDQSKIKTCGVMLTSYSNGRSSGCLSQNVILETISSEFSIQLTAM